MLRSLRARLLGSMLVATIVVVGATLLLTRPILENQARDDAQRELSRSARLAVDSLRVDGSRADVSARLSAEVGARVVVYGADDRPIGRRPAGPLSARELDRARGGRPVALVQDERGQAWLRYAIAADEGRVVEVSRPHATNASTASSIERLLLLAALLAVLVALVLAEYLTRVIGEPIRDITETADSLRRGDTSRRVRSRRNDELGALGSAIDQMADQLVERFDAIRREEARLRTILDTMVEGVLVTDRDGRIALTNAALTRMAGGDVGGRTAVEAIRSAELHEAVRRASQGNAMEVAFEIGAGTARRSIAAHVAPLPKRSGVVAVLHDVTQLKRADSVRRDFVANASHELRTPLTAIQGFAETLLDGALGDERMARRFVGNIAENAKRLHNLVEDLLELSRAESPESKVELTRIDVVQAAAKVLRSLEQRAIEKQQQLVLHGAGEVIEARADGRALDQVLLNLVDNALKYTPEGGRIRVNARLQEDRVVIEVSDTGPGIPRQHLDRIFERFYRVDKGRTRTQGGTGLGLSIVRHLVQRMGGEVSVESHVGEGTSFRVSLAAAEERPNETTRGPRELSGGAA